MVFMNIIKNSSNLQQIPPFNQQPLENLSKQSQEIFSKWGKLTQNVQPLQLKAQHITKTINSIGKDITERKSHLTEAQHTVFKEWAASHHHYEKESEKIKEEIKESGHHLKDISKDMIKWRAKIQSLVNYKVPSKLAFWSKKLTDEERMKIIQQHTYKMSATVGYQNTKMNRLQSNLMKVMNNTLRLRVALDSQLTLLGDVHQARNEFETEKLGIQNKLKKAPDDIKDALQQKLKEMEKKGLQLQRLETSWSVEGRLKRLQSEYSLISQGKMNSADLTVERDKRQISQLKADIKSLYRQGLKIEKAHSALKELSKIKQKLEKSLKPYDANIKQKVKDKLDLLEGKIHAVQTFAKAVQKTNISDFQKLEKENPNFLDDAVQTSKELEKEVQNVLRESSSVRRS